MVYFSVKLYNLVGGLEHVLFFHIMGISPSQLTNSIIFQRGRAQPPTSNSFPIIIRSILHILSGLFRYFWASTAIWVQVKIGGPEQAPGPHPFHTPVPYPRSIPPWRIRSIPLFHTSDPYVMIYMYICIYIYIYMYLYLYIYIYTPEYVQSDFTFVRAYLSAHTYMSVYMQE